MWKAAQNNSLYKIHIGFGFHVGCYHPCTGDTNDNKGVAPDLAAVREILDILDDENAAGIPVRAAWDFDNSYTLGRIFTNFGSDIASRIKGRCLSKKDEVMFATYNAGLLSAMTEDELIAAIQLAETNPDGSGIADMFGGSVPLVRPQMSTFSASQISMYAKSGICSMCLYKSAGKNDALSSTLKKFSEEELYNPVEVTIGSKEDGTISILPMLDLRDIYIEGSLTSFIRKLSQKQQTGSIKRDIFVFIDMDVRDELLKPMKVSGIARLYPNTQGLRGLIREASKFPGLVVFNTPWEYIQTHDVVSSICFGEDLASAGVGNLDESPWTHRIWTVLERGRLASGIYSQDCASPSFGARVNLLSAAHFEEGGRILSRTRRDRVLELTEEITEGERGGLREKSLTLRTSGRQRLNDSASGRNTYARRKDDEERCTFTVLNPRGHSFAAVQLTTDPAELNDITRLDFVCDECGIECWSAISMEYTEFPDASSKKPAAQGEVAKAQSAAGISSILLLIRFTNIRETYKVYYHISGKEPVRGKGKPIIEVHEYELPVFNPVGAMRRLLEAQGKLPPQPEGAVINAPVLSENDRLENSGTETRKADISEPGVGSGSLPDYYELKSTSGNMRIIISTSGADKGQIREFICGGRRIGGPQFLRQYLRYDNADFVFEPVEIIPAKLSGRGDGITILGEIHLPQEQEKGVYQLDILTVPMMEPFLIKVDVRYPRTGTMETDGYGVLADNRWQGVSPFEITPIEGKGLNVFRRDFMGSWSSYPVTDHVKGTRPEELYVLSQPVGPVGDDRSDESVVNGNYQLTGGLLGVSDSTGSFGLMIANARYVLGGIAFCPMRFRGDILKQEVSMNFFGTNPDVNGRSSAEVKNPDNTGIDAEKTVRALDRHAGIPLRTKASSFNGVRERMVLGLIGYSGSELAEEYVEQLTSLADGVLICGDETGKLHAYTDDNVFPASDEETRWEGFIIPAERGNTFASRCADDDPETAQMKKDLLAYFKESGGLLTGIRFPWMR